VTNDCIRHRLTLGYEANALGLAADDVIKKILKRVAVT